MPANLTPQYRKAEQEYKEAQTRDEKIPALENMIALLPKHKGTDKLFASLKRRLAKLKNQDDGKKAARTGGPKVPREGAAQVVLVGFPNVGKSRLLAAVSNAEPNVADYPFTTRAPQPGMMRVDDVQIQLVDLAAVSPDFMDQWVPDMIRGADAALLVVDAGDDGVLDQYQGVIERLDPLRIVLADAPGQRYVDNNNNAVLPTILVANKMDLPDATERLAILRDMTGSRFPLAEVSAETGEGLDAFRQRVWQHLQLIRVYTKAPGKPPDTDEPFTLPRGGTVEDLANLVHKDIGDNLKSARIWGHGVHAGQSVGRDHILHDGDLLELHV